MDAELKSHVAVETLVLTIHNPEHRNALSPEMYVRGCDALAGASRDPTIRSIVLTGQGRVFCAGGNLQRLKENRERSPDVQAQALDGLNEFIRAIRNVGKPVLAAVEGAAAGAGFSLALACDLIVAAEDAVFVMSYSTVALSPDGGASWFLPRNVPRQLATELLMTGNRVSARRLNELGLVNRIVPKGAALAEALSLASSLNDRAPNVLSSIKRLIEAGLATTMDEHLTHERDQFLSNLFHTNAGIGISAFLSKQPPKYE